MDIYFATTNKHKIKEAEIALKGSGIKIHILEVEKLEPEDWSIEEVAEKNAKKMAEETGKTIMLDDTGVFFEAFDSFPGAKPKRWFKKLGYEGLLAKFYSEKGEITNRKAYFKTVVGYCEPNKEPKLFTGKLHGQVAKEVKGMEADVLPYERIFICEDGRYLHEYSREEKNKISHRAIAFRKLRDFLVDST